jgi:hypothetical protein
MSKRELFDRSGIETQGVLRGSNVWKTSPRNYTLEASNRSNLISFRLRTFWHYSDAYFKSHASLLQIFERQNAKRAERKMKRMDSSHFNDPALLIDGISNHFQFATSHQGFCSRNTVYGDRLNANQCE